MKKILVLFAFIAAFAAPTFAQTDTQPAPTAAAATEKRDKKEFKRDKQARKQAAAKAAQEMGLTTEQKMRMKDIANNYKGRFQALKTDNTLSKEQKKAQIAEIRKSEDMEIKGVLNAEQYTKYSEKRAQRQQNARMRRGAK